MPASLPAGTQTPDSASRSSLFLHQEASQGRLEPRLLWLSFPAEHSKEGKTVATRLKVWVGRAKAEMQEPGGAAGDARLLLGLTTGLCGVDAEILGHVLAGWEGQGALGAFGAVLHLVVQVDGQAGGALLLLGVEGLQVVVRSCGAGGGRLHVCQQDAGHEQLQTHSQLLEQAGRRCSDRSPAAGHKTRVRI